MEYKQVGIPKPIFEEFEELRKALSYRNFSEFVVAAVRDKLDSVRWTAKDILERMETAKKQAEEDRI